MIDLKGNNMIVKNIACKVYGNPDDVAGFGYDGDLATTGIQNQDYLLQVPESRRMIIIPKSTTDTSKINIKIAVLGYEIVGAELGDCSIDELVNAINLVRTKATDLDAKLALGPSVYYWYSHNSEKALGYWNALVDGADLLFPQGKSLQSEGLTAYVEAYRSRYQIAVIRKPNLIKWCDLSPSPKGVDVTWKDMCKYWKAVHYYVDGVYVTHSDDTDEHTITKNFFSNCVRK